MMKKILEFLKYNINWGLVGTLAFLAVCIWLAAA